MVDVVAIEPGYFGGARRDPGERFSVADALWKDEKRRPKWVRLARSGAKAEPAGTRPSAKPPTPPEPIGNGVQEALGGPAPDWHAPEIQDSSQPVD